MSLERGALLFNDTDVNVARVILRHGPVPRTEVARMTGLTTGAVTKVTRKLLEQGFIEEGRPQPRLQGRPVVPLTMVDDSARCLGVKIVPGGAYLAVVGLTGHLHHVHRIDLDTSTLDSTVATLAELASAGEFAAIGVAIPAAVSHEGSLHATRMLGWASNGNLRVRMTRATGLPCAVANDVHGLTQHAHWFGALKGFENAVLITLGQGVGVGAVVDDELALGHQGAASILGRLWTPTGEVFGDVLSIAAIEARVAELGSGEATFPELLSNPAAAPILDHIAATMGHLARAAAIAYAPQRFLLTGEAIGVLEGRMDILQRELEADWREDLDVPELVVEPLEVAEFAVGAAGVAIRSLFCAD